MMRMMSKQQSKTTTSRRREGTMETSPEAESAPSLFRSIRLSFPSLFLLLLDHFYRLSSRLCSRFSFLFPDPCDSFSVDLLSVSLLFHFSLSTLLSFFLLPDRVSRFVYAPWLLGFVRFRSLRAAASSERATHQNRPDDEACFLDMEKRMRDKKATTTSTREGHEIDTPNDQAEKEYKGSGQQTHPSNNWTERANMRRAAFCYPSSFALVRFSFFLWSRGHVHFAYCRVRVLWGYELGWVEAERWGSHPAPATAETKGTINQELNKERERRKGKEE